MEQRPLRLRATISVSSNFIRADAVEFIALTCRAESDGEVSPHHVTFGSRHNRPSRLNRRDRSFGGIAGTRFTAWTDGRPVAPTTWPLSTKAPYPERVSSSEFP
jgi:hypothetical protein